jgi:hypothetical protein
MVGWFQHSSLACGDVGCCKDVAGCCGRCYLYSSSSSSSILFAHVILLVGLNFFEHKKLFRHF